MTGVAIGINASGGSPAYSAAQWRQAAALALMYDGRNMGARQGVRPGGNQLSVSLAGSTITVQPGVCALDPALSTPQGPYWVAIPTAETHTLTAADATNPRKDIVICRVYDHDEDASGLRLARTEYIAGTAAPSPAEPAVPAGATRLATIDVPASPGAPVVTDRRTWTVAPGGILPVGDSGDLAAGVAGRYRDRLDKTFGQLERDDGGAWREYPRQPVAIVRMTTGYTLNNGDANPATAAIPFDVEDLDIGGVWAPGAPRNFVIPANAGGIWHASATAQFAMSTGGNRELNVRLDGAIVFNDKRPPANASTTEVAISGEFVAGPGQIVSVQPYQDSGSNITVSVARATLRRVGPSS